MDPLRPFASLLRSLRPSAKARAADAPREKNATATPHPVARPNAQLQARLATLTEWHAPRAREIFVECVLLAELGDDLAGDPAFVSLIQEVSTHLSNQPQVSARLDHMLRELHEAAR